MSKRPNVLVFFTDQQRWDTTGVHGNPLDLTPNFDDFAARGTHLFHSFTCQPVCGPARSCLQTGLYATTTGCVTNSHPLPTTTRTLAHYFGDAGYKTGYIGKWHLAPMDSRNPGPVAPQHRGGYDYWLASNILEFTSDAYSVNLYDNQQREAHLPGYRVDACTDAAIQFLDHHQKTNAHQPFYLFLSLIEPHHQNSRDDYPAPDGYAARYANRWMPRDLELLGGNALQQLPGYCGMIKRVDEALGRLLDALKSLNLRDDTIILFSSDHGNHFKTRNSEYKRSCHEASIRVPTAFSGPGFEGTGRFNQLVSLIDLPPTLLDAAGIEVPAAMQGHSIMPLLRGESTQWPEDVFVQISESQNGRALRTQRWKYSVRAAGDEAAKPNGATLYREEFLYDLEADPYELSNLVAAPALGETREYLRERLLCRMEMAGENAPVILPVIPD